VGNARPARKEHAPSVFRGARRTKRLAALATDQLSGRDQPGELGQLRPSPLKGYQ